METVTAELSNQLLLAVAAPDFERDSSRFGFLSLLGLFFAYFAIISPDGRGTPEIGGRCRRENEGGGSCCQHMLIQVVTRQSWKTVLLELPLCCTYEYE